MEQLVVRGVVGLGLSVCLKPVVGMEGIMEIAVEHREQMERMIGEMRNSRIQCLKDFECYRSSLEKLCRIKGVDAFDTIECNSQEACCCGLSFCAVSKLFCRCPLRRYISEHFHR
jgi:hypothetical protein